MGAQSILSRLRKLDNKYYGITNYSVLGNLINQIGDEIDYIRSIAEQKINSKPEYNLLNQHTSELDVIGELYGLSRLVSSSAVENTIVHHQVVLYTKSYQDSIISVFQRIYGDQNNYPKSIYVQKDQLILRIDLDYDFLAETGQQSVIVPQTITNFQFVQILYNDKLEFQYDSVQLSDYLNAKQAININTVVKYETDEQFKLRIQSQLQNIAGPTTQSLESAVYSNLSNVRFVEVKNLARGLQTVDIIVFPIVTAVYDENNLLISNFQMQSSIRDKIVEIAPLGVDINVIDAKQVVFNIDVKASMYQTVQSQDDVVAKLRQIVINYLNSLDVGVQSTITKDDILNYLREQLYLLEPNVLIENITLKDITNQSVDSIDIDQDSYAVLSELTAQFTLI